MMHSVHVNTFCPFNTRSFNVSLKRVCVFKGIIMQHGVPYVHL